MNKLPKHVAIVMDGNGRWAAARKLPRVAGHQAGSKAVKEAIKFCTEKNIEVLTLFAFSSENWGRPATEVRFLMDLFLKTLQKETQSLHKNNIQLHVIGDRNQFNPSLQQCIINAEQMTANNTGLKLIIAANYSGRWDITQATQKIAQLVATQRLNVTDISEQLINRYVCLADLPEPDLLIRTSGELRISNFMLWQFAYTEFYFTEVLWPDFDATIFAAALNEFSARKRRFGLTNEQIDAEQPAEV